MRTPDAARWRGLHVLADDDPRWKHDPVTLARLACAGGAAVVQLRCKHSGDREALAAAREIRALTRAAGAAFVVNDRFDLALLAEADGVHLGQSDLPPGRIPDDVRRRLAIGRSTHTLEQARAAVHEPIDYLAFGPVFGTKSKPSLWSARGLDALSEVAAGRGERPLVAIGGVDATNAAAAVGAGADGVAVISAVAGADDPEAATRELVAALAGAAS